MSNELVRLEQSLQLGSLSSVLKSQENVMLLIDTSGSMASRISNTNQKRRIDALREVVANIKAEGHVPMIAFGGPYDAQVRFVDNVPEPDGGTPLHVAIPFAKEYGATRLVVVSDGMPDLPEECRIQATAFAGQIDVVFIGEDGETGSFFLDELAQATGGTRMQGDLSDIKKLTSAVIGFLEGAVEEKTIIQGEGFAVVEPEEEDDEEDDDADDDEEDDDEDDEENDEA